MGQKINSLGLRLKKRVNWNSSFCSHDLKHYSKTNLQNLQHDYVTHILLSKFHLFSNNLLIQKNSKNTQIYSKLFQKKDFIKNPKDFQNSDRYTLLKEERQSNKKLYLNQLEEKYNFADLFFNKTPKLFDVFGAKQLTLLAPRIITSYIAQQLNKAPKLKRNSFKNINSGITLFSYQLLRRLQSHLIGFKIICSGKWKKTRSGRKQRITIKFGRIRKSGLSNKILYNYSNQKTKYGSCGVKVWIAHKKLN